MTNTGGGSGREGGRALKTRVKTARKRSLSSTLWLERQLNDPFVAKAKREGFRSRAAYKLIEMAEKYKLFHPGQRIVDLGAAPGGWSQICASSASPNSPSNSHATSSLPAASSSPKCCRAGPRTIC